MPTSGGSAHTDGGTLLIVGVGIGLVGQTTIQAESAIRHADVVFYLASDNLTAEWIVRTNPNAHSLHDAYEIGKPRIESYDEMVRRLLAPVRTGQRVCAAFYGHPGVFVYPSHIAIREARKMGFRALMLPGVSAEDCLFADLGLDPALSGCLSYEATDFLLHRRTAALDSLLILWQVGVIGHLDYQEPAYDADGLNLLCSVLCELYDKHHEVILYEAPTFPLNDPIITKVALGALPHAKTTPTTTLIVPPQQVKRPDPGVLRNLGIPRSALVVREAKSRR